ncbi:peptidyl-tRNA hydrolase [Desulfitobacterium dichloroeliminans LMG P-21439]|uniref:Peptidyl-tRNA hydrolase n=1 Tax=Desulfitobacterium dichloroeliminans (strain LMG P-21439 / DCA1) TaxID=871963 RepID=L0F4P2_DESDL|nr:aminoacyl-tRNA hydrolase [Desulfitobacterium dichloroeliminans]AGA67631.1 peptidyl-tRNA hydrolase [Desulfitobacterium dichloroeliminans LMG P-21439]
MKLIVGLGNPGVQYAETRHNAGFLLLDCLAEELNLDFRSKFQGLVSETQIGGEKIYLLKPQTFMNLSGRSIREVVQFYKIAPQDILVIYDDMDLAVGRLRLRSSGSAGGHNGIKSTIAELGSEDFWRLKVGIGRPPTGWDSARYVLASFAKEEIPVLEEVLDKGMKAVTLWAKGEGDKAMNEYNR